MKSLKSRIASAFEALPHEKQNKKKLADYCGVKPPSVNGWFTGSTQSLKGHSLIRAAEYLNVADEWLSSGTGRRARDFDANTKSAPPRSRQVPLLNYIQAGDFADMGSNFSPEGMEYLLTNARLSENSFGLEIKGDSMRAPPGGAGDSFKEGEYIIVDCDISPRPGDYVVAKNGGHEATFKKYRVVKVDESGHEIFELSPLNPDYPSLRSDDQPIYIIGVVVEHIKPLRRP